MKRIRIKANPGVDEEKYININLEQEFDFLDVLSISISQTDSYRNFNSDYGCVVGRVIGNGGTGIPNAKVSIFIPIDDIDINDPVISNLYPYKLSTDRDVNNNKYNILSRLRKYQPLNGWGKNKYGIGYTPRVPVGTLPAKEEILTNPTLLYVYEKYYKFSTVTNSSGDYMLFGVPTGTQNIHMDCDITDIGKFSMPPAILVKKLGISPDMFVDDGTLVDGTREIGVQPHIQSQDTTIEVRSFWGDKDNYEIGITRKDFNIVGEIIPTINVIGSNFTMAKNAFWGDKIIFRLFFGLKNICFRVLRVNVTLRNIMPFIKIQAFTFKPDDLDGGKFDLEALAVKNLGKTDTCGNPFTGDFGDDESDKLDLKNHRIDTVKTEILYYPDEIKDDKIVNGKTSTDDLVSLRNSEYVEHVEPGQFGMVIPCNRNKMVTDESGNLVLSTDPNKGVYTNFNGSMYFHMSGDIETPKGKITSARVFLKVPRTQSYGNQFITETFNFNFGEYYSVAQYIARGGDAEFWQTPGYFTNVKIIKNNVLKGIVQYDPTNQSSTTQRTKDIGFCYNWLIGSLYFIQFAYKSTRKKQTVSTYIISKGDIISNDNLRGGDLVNTQYLQAFNQGNNNGQTNFVKLDKPDIITIAETKDKSLVLVNPNYPGTDVNNPTKKYFFKGLGQANIIDFMVKKNML